MARKTGQKRELTRQKVIDAALEVLKETPTGTLTMRQVADRCGVTAMAIYHHVEDKELLKKLAVDQIFLDVAGEMTTADKPWREAIIDMWITIRTKLLETPGAGMIFVSQAIVGPGTARTTEEMFRLLHNAGLRGDAVAEAADSMTILSIGSIANELTRPARVRDGLGRQIDTAEMPYMGKYLTHYSHRNAAQRYERALNWLLDGIFHKHGLSPGTEGGPAP